MVKKTMPHQKQDIQPGLEAEMDPKPEYIRKSYIGSSKLAGKNVLITGGDSGIGRAVAVHMAAEGANISLTYLDSRELEDAELTRKLVEDRGVKCILLEGDLKAPDFCTKIVEETINAFGKIHVLVNNAAVQFPQKELIDISDEQLELTFKTNIFPYFMVTRKCLEHMESGASIINTASITAYEGSPRLVDYSSTKGAIVSFTRALAAQVAEKGIRVNGVAPGPIWTPLIPASFTAEEVAVFGGDTPMKRPGQPSEVAPAYVFLACDDSSYITGQMIHVNGGTPVGG